MTAASPGWSVRKILSSFVRFASRLAGRESAWDHVAMRVPASVFGPGSRQAFDKYFEGKSGVRVGTIDDIISWLQTCEYVTDLELFREPDVWQHPALFEKMKRGDCEDFALWAWRKLAELGIDADFCVGRVICADRPEIDRQHAWVIYRVNGIAFLFEPAARATANMIRPLADVMDQYVPHFAVNQGFDTYAFVGCATDAHRFGSSRRDPSLAS
jgi:hypothetical protein